MDTSNIILIGMPSAGKSTLGVVLAKKIGMRFVDTDLLLQEGAGCLLCEYIEEHGNEGFKEYENSILAGLDCNRHVIATGGSAVYGKEAMEHLSEMGPVVFIDVNCDTMKLRLGDDLKARGMVIEDGMTLEELYEERHALYEKYADITVVTDDLNTREAVEAIEAALKEYNAQ